ncbi:hypothetical protein TWF788_005990 [Orbilia oligospora]|uniref:Protein Zds1 C-terminal domain-containing protein n=1 Tax=Orbilia oligospora TaxID=2813651 RepID=A0A7C8PX29_ORBOL|nr:hypothetical protein TWF788_005990 [Orbilia oligospora]
MKSATQSRYNRYPQPTTDQTSFHSREASLGDNDHVTAAIGDLYGGSDEDNHDAEDQYRRHHQRRPHQQGQQSSIRYHHSHPLSSQALPVTPPQTPTKSRKSPSSSGNQSRTSPHMDNTSPSSLSGSSTLRVPGNSPNANQAFPLNNIDYESNPDAVQQELENLQALRRLSMDVSSVANDPDLPSFNNFFPSVAPKGRADDDDAARLFWVPARLHPELAPKAFKNFVESRVEQIREHEGNVTTDGLQAGPSLRRKKSMLSRQIDTEGKAAEGYEDGADKLRRNRSNSEGEQVLTVSELGEVLGKKDPVDLMRQMSLSKAEKALIGDAGQDEDDQPIFPAPPPGGSLRRSTRTALRRGSIRKGERVAPSSRRAKLAAAEEGKPGDEPEFKLFRVRTEPIPSISISSDDEETRPQSSSSRQQEMSMKSRTRQPVSLVSPISPEEPKRQAIAPPGLSQRPISPPDRPTSERMARSKSEPESPSPPPREPIPPIPSQPAKAERKEVSSSSQRVSKEPRGGPPNGQLPTLPPAPSPPSAPESSSGKQKRPTLKRGSPGTSSYEPTKDATPGPPSQQPGEVKRKELPSHGGQQGPTKEVGRKSSWSWLTLGGDGDKEKDKEREKEKDSGSKKVRKAKSMEKDRDRDDEKERKREIKREKERERDRERSSDREHARLDLLQKSIDGPKKRESIDGNTARPSMDSLERERDKEKEKASSRKASGSDKEKEKKEPGIFSSIFGGSKKKQEETKSKSKQSNLAVPSGRSKSPPAQTYYYTRFPIHIERAIYRLSHLKLANPRRPLLQQVLLSNFMYAYLAKVQQMQPPNAVQGAQQQQQIQQQQQQQQVQQQQQAQQAQQYQQQQLEQQYHQQQHGGAQSNGDDSQQLDSDEEDYDFDDDGRDDRPYDSQQGYNARTASRDAPNSNGGGYNQDYDGGGYGYQEHEQQQYQQEQQVYYQQQQGGSAANGHPGDGGYHEKDYDYYQDHEGYDRRGDGRRYEGGGSVSGNRYHHQQSMNDDRDRDYSDEMW